MAGNNAADYTGAICAPEHAEKALQAFGRHVAQMGWARLNLENLRMSRERIFAFIGQFSRDIFALSEYSRVNAADNVDNCRCFAAELPDSFDAYLDGVLGTNTRQKLRRFLRKVASGELRITRADAATYEHDIETLLEMWRIKWGARKGDRLQAIMNTNRRVLRDSFKAGTLFLPMLWQGERPLGALAVFVDPVKKSLLFFMAGRDEAVHSIPVGLILHGHCIKLAIENGFATYDFLRGDEPYKFAFGVTESRVNCAAIHTRSGRNVGDRLDPRSLDDRVPGSGENPSGGSTGTGRKRLPPDPGGRPAACPRAVWPRTIAVCQGRPPRSRRPLHGIGFDRPGIVQGVVQARLRTAGAVAP